VVDWNNGGLRLSRAKGVCRRKEFGMTKKSLGGFDGWRGLARGS
jgi:hypothetical protein